MDLHINEFSRISIELNVKVARTRTRYNQNDNISARRKSPPKQQLNFPFSHLINKFRSQLSPSLSTRLSIWNMFNKNTLSEEKRSRCHCMSLENNSFRRRRTHTNVHAQITTLHAQRREESGEFEVWRKDFYLTSQSNIWKVFCDVNL